MTVEVNGSYNLINQVLEDRYNNVWMVNRERVVKYNGYTYSTIPFETIFGNSLKNDRIKKIIKDSDGRIWIQSFKGLIAKQNNADQFQVLNGSNTNAPFPFKVKTFISYGDHILMADFNGAIYSYEVKNDILNQIIQETNYDIEDLLFNNLNTIFIGTSSNDVYAFSIEDKKLHKLDRLFDHLPEKIVLAVDKDNYLWIATWGQGIFRYKFKNGIFEENTNLKEITNSFENNVFITMFCDSSNHLYFGTDGDGLYKLGLNDVKLEHFKYNPVDKYSLSTNTILSLSEDSSNNVWVLTHYGNINVLRHNLHNIDYYSGTESGFSVRVLSICKSTSNNLWIGTSGEGVTKIDLETGVSKKYAISKNSKKGLFAFAIQEDSNKNIWVGTYQNGLWIYNYTHDTFSKVQRKGINSNEISEIRYLYKDSQNRMWVSSNTSLDVYDKNKNLLYSYPLNSNGLKGNISQGIVEDKYGYIWVIYNNGGLFKFDENKLDNNLSRFNRVSFPDEIINENFSLESIAAFDEDLWILKKGALYNYNLKSGAFKSYINHEPFEGVNFKSVKVEDKHNIWLSSDKGIWHLNPKELHTENYQLTDGFQSNVFMERSSYKDDLGKIYFGGVNGLNAFYPRDLSKRGVDVSLNINDIEILNKSLSTVAPKQINDGVQNIETLDLKYNQSSISFRFSAIGNILNPNYFYAYKLEGFDDEWVYTENELKAVYTNLPPRDYKFKLKAGTKQGTWDIGTKEITIKVRKPLWLSFWAFGLYCFAGILILIVLKRWAALRKKLYLEEIRNSNEKKLNEMQMDFFAKMSHEIQTPLTLILGPIERLFKSNGQNNPTILNQRLRTIYNNAHRLSRLTSNLTMVRDKKLNILKLQVYKSDFIKFLREVAFSFEDHANARNINFNLNFPYTRVDIWYDRDKVEHVLYNILSNAFKFTPKFGEIHFDVKLKESTIQVLISNTGKAISKKDLSKIFDMFYQSKSGSKQAGSGIGLSLTKELIELHHGSIAVTSNSKNTCFKFELPLIDVYSNEEKLSIPKTRLNLYDEKETKSIFKIEDGAIDEMNKSKTILVVEDNYELQSFLLDIFKDNYKVIIADDGIEGLELAKKYVPNIILSDIVMPKMNGLEMTKKILNNKNLSHIPIVLMTSESDTSMKLDGLKTGAIEYVKKPFKVNELLLKIRNIISTNEQIRDKYKRDLISIPKVEIAKSDDEKLLHRIVVEVENEIQNPNFDLASLANKLKMTQTTLYRKCQALTGKTLVEFVRLVRLKKAAIILYKHEYSISEVAFIVGFNDQKYFSKSFKKAFKMSPMKFKKMSKQKGGEKLLKEYNLYGII